MLAGVDVTEALSRLGAALRQLHDTEVADCPWSLDLDALVDRAGERVAAELVDTDDLDPPYQRYTPAALLDLVRRGRPPAPVAPCLVHGRARLAALSVVDATVTWSDVGSAGVGDPYRDLATMALDLIDAVSPEAVGPFLDAYGVSQPDLLRLDWHVLVDQLLR